MNADQGKEKYLAEAFLAKQSQVQKLSEFLKKIQMVETIIFISRLLTYSRKGTNATKNSMGVLHQMVLL